MSELVRRPPEGGQERSGEELYEEALRIYEALRRAQSAKGDFLNSLSPEEALRFAHQVAVKEPVQVDPADRPVVHEFMFDQRMELGHAVAQSLEASDREAPRRAHYVMQDVVQGAELGTVSAEQQFNYIKHGRNSAQ